MEHMNEGDVVVTPLSDNQYDIWFAGGVISDRSKILKKWEDAANKACNGKYEITKEQTTGQNPAGTMAVEGRIRCK